MATPSSTHSTRRGGCASLTLTSSRGEGADVSCGRQRKRTRVWKRPTYEIMQRAQHSSGHTTRSWLSASPGSHQRCTTMRMRSERLQLWCGRRRISGQPSGRMSACTTCGVSQADGQLTCCEHGAGHSTGAHLGCTGLAAMSNKWECTECVPHAAAAAAAATLQHAPSRAASLGLQALMSGTCLTAGILTGMLGEHDDHLGLI